MQNGRPYALSIAGFDPSGGAGLLADIKTFEQQMVQGFGVCSALTYQTATTFTGMEWVGETQIKAQLLPLLEAYPIEAVKFGIVESPEVMVNLIQIIRKALPDVMIVLDPVLKASAGYTFHQHPNHWEPVLNAIDLLTPNISEAQQLTGLSDASEAAAQLSKYCAVLLKGGHAIENTGVDVLYHQKETVTFEPHAIGSNKHGSGCILSAAITARLALGETLTMAISNAKNYITEALQSNKGLLSYHEK